MVAVLVSFYVCPCYFARLVQCDVVDVAVSTHPQHTVFLYTPPPPQSVCVCDAGRFLTVFVDEMRSYSPWQQTGTVTGIRYGGTKRLAIWPNLSRVSIKDWICMLRSVFMHQRKRLCTRDLINICSQ